MPKKQTIVLCSSAYFYKHLNQIADELSGLGFVTIVPRTAADMRASGDYDVSKVRTWIDNLEDIHKKTDFMKWHFDKITDNDAILVINDNKPNQPAYIGANVLIEMGLAFYLNKPIYVLNPAPKTAPYYEEVMGMNSIILHGDLAKIK
jgi:diphthamide synthase subunit DPH2